MAESQSPTAEAPSDEDASGPRSQWFIAGGIAFATPEGKGMGAESKDGAVFKLYTTPHKSWYKWKPNITLNNKASTK